MEKTLNLSELTTKLDGILQTILKSREAYQKVDMTELVLTSLEQTVHPTTPSADKSQTAVQDIFQKCLKDNLTWQFWGAHEAAWPAYYNWPHIALRPMHSPEECERLQWWLDLAKSTGWWEPYDGFVIATERPELILLDEEGRLHCENGPALRCRDGWSVWCIHGVDVGEQIVMRPETQTIEEIEGENNQEIKRIRIERFGWGRYIQETGATVAHKRYNERDAQWETLYVLKDGTKRVEVSDPSTGRKYFLGVPRETETCEAAQTFMSFGLDARAVHRS